MFRIIITSILVAAASAVVAQTKFIYEGKIEFERKINVHRQWEPDDNDAEFFKEFMSKQPKTNTAYFDLLFREGQTIYKPGKDGDGKGEMIGWLLGPAKENSVLTQLAQQRITSRKKVFEDNFLIEDSIRQYEWHITNELRTIAGFECRKAVTRICDSVYVVAFYTEEIPVSGGPESFSGLPGMILGLAVPRLFTTWFATKVELVEPKATDFVLNGKGKKITPKELEATLQKSMADWKKNGPRNIWWTML
ncbi:GLPGLI family protein [Flavihumibacter rivuli]|uniref:GLPGLI family protein n=1 Tax=Flavihumibacter rivuli TaxID=2838156 RepID=UPI001BDDE633|nr:GLPGLI family protein [Flavihumibacter rivuli]ULQ57580.1 GLPGLI family protein [Flavihumibacter rivuli]